MLSTQYKIKHISLIVASESPGTPLHYHCHVSGALVALRHNLARDVDIQGKYSCGVQTTAQVSHEHSNAL